MSYTVFRDLAVIILAAKFFGLVARKIKVPQVVGEIVAGLVIGPFALLIIPRISDLFNLGIPATFELVHTSDFILQMAQIGVILLMFSAGLETNLRDLLKTGPMALLIACAGVFVPLAGGTLLYMCFYGFSSVGSPDFFKALFIGTIMTATSVSITVEALKEMGHLKGKIGTTILNAAIIDDIIGMLVLTVVIGFTDDKVKPVTVCINTFLFICFAIVGGYILYKIFKKVDQRYPHSRRITIAGLGLCLITAYCAERFFGIADITGAYVAGIILCNIHDSEYIARRMDINSYVLFGPIFFASIGLKTKIDGFSMDILWFSIAFVLVAMLTKIIGCSLVAMACKLKPKHALKVGVGMMTRGEVALIVSQKGMAVGLLNPIYFTSVILLIIASSIMTPIILKVLYKKWPEEEEAA